MIWASAQRYPNDLHIKRKNLFSKSNFKKSDNTFTNRQIVYSLSAVDIAKFDESCPPFLPWSS